MPNRPLTQRERAAVFAQRETFSGADSPKVTLAPFRGPKHTLEVMAKSVLGDRGERSTQVRFFTEDIVRFVQPKDYLGETLALRHAMVQSSPTSFGTPWFKYCNDPKHVELCKDPLRMVEEIARHGSTVIDCDEYAIMLATMALQIGREVELVAMGFAPQSLSHVAVRIKEPKSGTWIFCDGVAGPREREAAAKAKELLVWSLD